MRQIGVILTIIILFGCKNYHLKDHSYIHTSDTRNYILKFDIKNYQNSKFYTDYNIFDRKGINEIICDTLDVPFFQMYSISDSFITLKIFFQTKIESFLIPTGNQIVYSFFDIYDGPRYIYSKIEGNKILRYGYNQDPYHTKKLVLPSVIEIIKQDTFYCYSTENFECLDTFNMKDKILPFKGKLNKECENCLVQFYNSDPKDSILHHYYRNINPIMKLGKQNPGDGIYGYKRTFKYWREFHNLQRMI